MGEHPGDLTKDVIDSGNVLPRCCLHEPAREPNFVGDVEACVNQVPETADDAPVGRGIGWRSQARLAHHAVWLERGTCVGLQAHLHARLVQQLFGLGCLIYGDVKRCAPRGRGSSLRCSSS